MSNTNFSIREKIIQKYENLSQKRFSERKFVHMFGKRLIVVSEVYSKILIQNQLLIEHLLLYFYYLKHKDYDSPIWNIRSKDTFFKYFYHTAWIVYQSLNEVHKFTCNHYNQAYKTFNNAKYIMDTTPFEYVHNEDAKLQHNFWSVHYNMCCIKYLFIVCRFCGKCVYCSHPYYGNCHDLTIFRKESKSIFETLGFNILLIADEIFHSLIDPICNKIIIGYRNPQTSDEKSFNSQLSHIRGKIERFNHRFKDFFEIFTSCWRGRAQNIEDHELIVKSYINVVNIELDFFPLNKINE